MEKVILLCSKCGRPLAESGICSCESASEGISSDNIPLQPQFSGGQQLNVQKKRNTKTVVMIIVISLSLIFISIGGLFICEVGKFVHQAHLSSIDSTSQTMNKAINTALSDMKEKKGTDVKGVYIVSSDKNRNVDVPFDMDEFYYYMGVYLEKSKELEYFAVIRDGQAEYVAVMSNIVRSRKWNKKTDLIGTYPKEGNERLMVYCKEGSKSFSGKKTDMKTLFNKACKELFG